MKIFISYAKIMVEFQQLGIMALNTQVQSMSGFVTQMI